MKKLCNYFLIIFMLFGDGYFLIHAIQTGDMSRVPTYLVLLPILAVPALLRHFFHIKISEHIELVYLIFILLAQFLGSVVNLYNQIAWFDLFTHFLSGILTSFLALIFLVKWKQNPTKKISFNITYILGFVFLVAGLWEFFEFGMDQMTGSNLQHWIDTGVHDTMEDMLAAFIGCLLFLIKYTDEMLKNKNGFIRQFINSI